MGTKDKPLLKALRQLGDSSLLDRLTTFSVSWFWSQIVSCRLALFGFPLLHFLFLLGSLWSGPSALSDVLFFWVHLLKKRRKLWMLYCSWYLNQFPWSGARTLVGSGWSGVGLSAYYPGVCFSRDKLDPCGSPWHLFQIFSSCRALFQIQVFLCIGHILQRVL